jgi:hypothetical protein
MLFASGKGSFFVGLFLYKQNFDISEKIIMNSSTYFCKSRSQISNSFMAVQAMKMVTRLASSHLLSHILFKLISAYKLHIQTSLVDYSCTLKISIEE